MAKESGKEMTVKEAKELRVELEDQIVTLVNDYETKTGAIVDNIWLNRKRAKGTEPEVFKEPKGKVINAEMNIRFDL